MQFADFRSLIDRLLADVPPEYKSGIVAVDVSASAVPHPVRADVYTLGECIPLEWSGDGADLQSRVVLYYGSFRALSRLGPLDWRAEAWETLTHELRHHLEWRARVAALEEYDWAAEHNFARHEKQEFDPVFYRAGERLGDGIYKVEDDVFVELAPERATETTPVITWHGRAYGVPLPPDLGRPAFVTLEGLDEPPPGQVVLVLPRRASLRHLFRRSPPVHCGLTVTPLKG